MKPVWWMILWGVVRHALTIAGAWLVSRGLIDADTQARLVSEGAAQIVGWALMLGPIAWSVAQKTQVWGWVVLAVKPYVKTVTDARSLAPGPTAPLAWAAPFVLVAALFTGCAGMPVDNWLPRAQQLVEGSVSAHTNLLTLAGNAYRVEGQRCMAVSTVRGEVDGLALYDCMRPANDARDRVESAATAYRQTATAILTAKSWPEVLVMIPTLRNAASQFANVIGSVGGDEQAAFNMLNAPINAAEGTTK